MSVESRIKELRRCRWWIGIFIGGLVISGVTAIPLEWELRILTDLFGAHDPNAAGLNGWLARVHVALKDVSEQYPFIGYGFDWLAFGHLMIALAMVGVWIDPVKNEWLFTFGAIACVLVIPWAFVFGAIRGIPVGWRLIDCSFGVFGLIPLILARSAMLRLRQNSGGMNGSTCAIPSGY